MVSQIGFVFASLSILLILVLVLVKALLLDVTVDQISMSPTLEPGDRVLAVRHWPSKLLRRGQVVLVVPGRETHQSSGTPNSNQKKLAIKRIIGMPGDTVAISDGGVKVIPASRFGAHDAAAEFNRKEGWILPPGNIFVCGDNAPVSVDSRAWGPLLPDNIKGIVVLKLPQTNL